MATEKQYRFSKCQYTKCNRNCCINRFSSIEKYSCVQKDNNGFYDNDKRHKSRKQFCFLKSGKAGISEFSDTEKMNDKHDNGKD